MMKKILLVITLMAVLSLTACGPSTEPIKQKEPSVPLPEQASYDEMIAGAGLSKEQGDRIDELLYVLDGSYVSYSFDGAKGLGLTSLQRLTEYYLADYAGEDVDFRDSDMKGILTEEQLLNGFENLFGVREIPFGYEFTDWQDHNAEMGEVPLTHLFQKGIQGLPEMGGLAAEFQVLSIEKRNHIITVKREMHFHNGEVYFYDANSDTFYFRDEAEEKFGGGYDFINETKLPDGLEIRCFPSFVRIMEYAFEIADDGNIFIRSGKVIG